VVFLDKFARDVRVVSGNIMLIVRSEMLCVRCREKDNMNELGVLEASDE
jgi:hypothetical protein